MKSSDIKAMIAIACLDFRHEGRMSLCSVFALAAILGPLLVLFGLKFGIVSVMLDRLAEDPRNREIIPKIQGRFDADWIDRLSGHPSVGFVIPKTRHLAGKLLLRNRGDKDSEPLRVELIPTGEADPLFEGEFGEPESATSIILSHEAGRKLRAKAGDVFEALIRRTVTGETERVRFELTVQGVLPLARYPREVAFVDLPLLLAVESFREGYGVPAFDWPGVPRDEDVRNFASFRLYAVSIFEVAALRDHLNAEGVDVITRATEIEQVLRLDRDLTLLFFGVAGLGAAGYALSLASNLLGNVMRKRRELSTLRLLGFSRVSITTFPIVQAVLISVLGCLLAGAFSEGVSAALNTAFSDRVLEGERVCRLLLQHHLAAFALTLSLALAASAAGGLMASRVTPAEGLRDE